jgi:heat shock protein HslJ
MTANSAYTAALLEGTWTVMFVQPMGLPRQDRPTTATYTLTFTDGRFSARADCNMCGGAFAIAGTTINVGPSLACTRAACATASFESLYTAILGGASEIALNGSTLTLTSARGTVQLARN